MTDTLLPTFQKTRFGLPGRGGRHPYEDFVCPYPMVGVEGGGVGSLLALGTGLLALGGIIRRRRNDK